MIDKPARAWVLEVGADRRIALPVELVDAAPWLVEPVGVIAKCDSRKRHSDEREGLRGGYLMILPWSDTAERIVKHAEAIDEDVGNQDLTEGEAHDRRLALQMVFQRASAERTESGAGLGGGAAGAVLTLADVSAFHLTGVHKAPAVVVAALSGQRLLLDGTGPGRDGCHDRLERYDGTTDLQLP